MKVYVNAFQLESHAMLSVDSFLQAIVRDRFAQIKHSGRDRVIAVGDRGAYLAGMVLSTKDQKNFITVRMDDDNNPVATVQQTASGEPMADVNFFVVNRKTGCGVFSTYRGAGGTTVFGNILRKLYHKQVADVIEVEITELGEVQDDVSDDDKKTIRAKFKGAHITLTPIMTDPDFENDLRKFAKFSKFEYIEPTVSDPRFSPIRKQISKQRRVYYIVPEKTLTTKIRKFLAKFVAGSNISEGTVYGKLASGEDDSLPIQSEAYCMAKYPHDSVVIAENIRLDAVATVPMIDTLLAEVQSRRELFE